VTRLKDVADRAGVSTATVSRVLNGLGPMSNEARGRVLKASRALDYHPNWLAKSLRGRPHQHHRPHPPDIENPFFHLAGQGGRAGGVGTGLERHPVHTDEDLHREEVLVRTLVERRIDGLILCPVAGSQCVPYAAPGAPPGSRQREPHAAGAAFRRSWRTTSRGLRSGRHLLARGCDRSPFSWGRLSSAPPRRAWLAVAAPPPSFACARATSASRWGLGRMGLGYKAALECLEARRGPGRSSPSTT